MISPWLIVLFAFLYLCLLFYVGYQGDKRTADQISVRKKAIIYSLSLGVYCSSWTFYGAVGSASNNGIGFLPIYLGPIFIFLFGWPILKRIAVLSFEQKTTSIADFIASRYGKSRSLAVLVTCIAILAVVPYLALQLKAITMGFDVMVNASSASRSSAGNAFYITVILIVFSILFGTRKLDVTEHKHGLMNAIAFESIVKLCAFIAVGVFAFFILIGGEPEFGISTKGKELFFSGGIPNGFVTQCFLAMAAIICLPRQFHVSFVEYHHPKDLELARWIFPLYLSFFCVLVLPISIAGLEYFSQTSTNADTYVIALPLLIKQNGLAMLALIGGFSAATGMVIVACITLSTMISNDIVMPLLNYFQKRPNENHQEFSFKVLTVRRIVIAVLMFIAYYFYRISDRSQSLANIGLLAFSVVAHFSPAILLGIYWRRANQVGAFLGMSVGVFVWIFLAGLPGLRGADLLAVQDYSYFGFTLLTEATLVSLSLNLVIFIFCSFSIKTSMSERIQSYVFTIPISSNPLRSVGPANPSIQIVDLQNLAASILGEAQATESFSHWLSAQEQNFSAHDSAPAELIRDTELMLSGVIGAPSARALILSALKDKGVDLDDVIGLFASTSDALRFNRNLLENVLNNIDQGISVVDTEFRMVGWNKRYLEIMKYPEGFVYAGKPLAEIIHFNATRGFCGPGDVADHVSKRIARLESGKSYRFERFRDDGIILEIIGNPMPGGGYVTTYTDISEYKKIEAALRENEANISIYTDNSPTQLAFINASSTLVFCNNTFAEQFSKSKEELIGLDFNTLVHDSALHEIATYLAAAFTGQKQHFELETVNRDYLLATIIPDIKEQSVAGLYIVFQDITSRRHAELALQDINTTLEERVAERTHTLSEAVSQLNAAKLEAEQANFSKSRFLAAASHDLLQPFNAAKLFAAVLESGNEPLPGKQSEIVKKMSSSLQSAENILRSLIEISKLDTGNIIPNISTFPIQPVLDLLENQFIGLAESKSLKFKIRPSSAIVRTDRQLLQRVLQNLVSNAIRYTEEGGVLIACRKNSGKLNINVWDTGLGIDSKDQRIIFEEFKQLKTSTTNSDDQGIGLGLAISHRLAGLLGSELRVSSEFGRGSCFAMDVELSAASPVSEKINSKNNTPDNINFENKLNILCLDNERQILSAMKVLLQDWNCNVRVVRNRTELTNLLAAGFEPELIFADYHLDHNDNGIDVLDDSRHKHSASCTIISADHSADLQALAEERGYTMLLKPVDPSDLRKIIEATKQKSSRLERAVASDKDFSVNVPS